MRGLYCGSGRSAFGLDKFGILDIFSVRGSMLFLSVGFNVNKYLW